MTDENTILFSYDSSLMLSITQRHELLKTNKMVPLPKQIAENKAKYVNPFFISSSSSSPDVISRIENIESSSHIATLWNSYFLRHLLSSTCDYALNSYLTKAMVTNDDNQQQTPTALCLAEYSLPFITNSFSLAMAEVTAATRLKTLELRSNHLLTIPSFILKTTSLKKLILCNNELFSIPPQVIRQCLLLEELNLKGNHLIALPSTIKDLSKLTRLVISENLITEINEEEVPATLQSFEIAHNPLVSSALVNQANLIPPRVGLLDLSSLSLPSVPRSLRLCSQLQILNLSDNDLKTFSLGDFTTSLVELNFSHNRLLKTLPEALFSMTNLRKLYLDGCSLQCIPASIQRLSKLRRLSLEDNELEFLPLEMGEHLSDLQELKLSQNRFSSFPSAVIKQLPKLEFLLIHHNNLSVLPNDIFSRLPELSTLDISYNKISHLPVELGKLQTIKTLKVAGNPWRFPPPEIIAQGVSSLIEYLRSMLGQDALLNNQLSLMVVGHEKSGKTSVVKGLVEKRECSQDISYLTSSSSSSASSSMIDIIGMRENIKLWSDSTNSNKTTLLFDTWDFTGGDLVSMAAHLFFRTDTTLYLLCWNLELTVDDARLEYWLQLISRRAPQAPVIIVGTHSEYVSKAAALATMTSGVFERFNSRFPDNVRSVVAVSWTKRLGFDKLWRSIESALQNESWMGECFPARFRQLKDSLAHDAEKRGSGGGPSSPFDVGGRPPIITTKEIHALCDSVGIPAQQHEAAIATMVRFGTLHSLPGDTALFVLDVGWLVRFVSSLFQASKTVWLNGRLKHHLLQEIWDPNEYDPKYHPLMIDLLGVSSPAFILLILQLTHLTTLSSSETPTSVLHHTRYDFICGSSELGAIATSRRETSDVGAGLASIRGL